MTSIIKQPSAWVPIALSLIMFTIMLVMFMLSGPPVREADEGVGAHLFQIWLVLEVFLITFFALKWLPRNPTPALLILTIQIVAVLATCFPVFYFHL